ncbi:MAG: hypothetical protein Q8R92_00675, partial [Deltaproteobacteria bacterium]|nr:hypothetical protein [Deltaproteobacteria bacterium]
MTFDKLILSSSISGRALWAGNNPYSGGHNPPLASPAFQRFFKDNPEFVQYERQAHDGRLALETSRAYRRKVIEFWREEPWKFIKYLPVKLYD